MEPVNVLFAQQAPVYCIVLPMRRPQCHRTDHSQRNGNPSEDKPNPSSRTCPQALGRIIFKAKRIRVSLLGRRHLH